MGKYRNLALNTILFAANAVATKLISFVLVPLYTTYMSAGEYGLTDMSLTVISLITPIVTLDVAEAALRFIVGNKEKRNLYVVVSLAVTMVSVAVVALLTPLLDLGVFGGLGAYKIYFIFAYTASAFMNLCGEIARSSGEVKLIPVCAGVSSVVTLVLSIGLVGGLRLGVIGYFISVTIGPLLAIIVYLTVGGLASMAVDGASCVAREGLGLVWSVLAPMLRYALPLIPNSLLWWAGISVSRLIITGMMGITASGMYAAASKVPNIINTAFGIFQQAWQLSAFQESADNGVARFYERVFCIIQAGLTILCALLSALSPLLAALLLRGETYDSWPMIPMLLLANLMNVFSSFFGTVYTTTMNTSSIIRTTIFGAISCAVLTPLLIPGFGTLGACIASVVGQGLVFVARAKGSQRYIMFDVGWRRLVLTLVLLCVQSVAMVWRLGPWRSVSLACLLCVLAIQARKVIPVVLEMARTRWRSGEKR